MARAADQSNVCVPQLFKVLSICAKQSKIRGRLERGFLGISHKMEVKDQQRPQVDLDSLAIKKVDFVPRET
jgi:hypothetical protein